ncbi:Uncharacterised protein [Vibrio cholerae]|nr:Uncharacterised protein [Vibrio cholerae]
MFQLILSLIFLAGLPAAMQYWPIDFVTVELMPIIEPEPISTPFKIVTLSASHT